MKLRKYDPRDPIAQQFGLGEALIQTELVLNKSEVATLQKAANLIDALRHKAETVQHPDTLIDLDHWMDLFLGSYAMEEVSQQGKLLVEG